MITLIQRQRVQAPLALVALLLAASLAACDQRRPLAPSFESAEALAEVVLDRYRAGDEAGLRALALTEQEFRQHVWPELPAARPERNLPFSYVWGDLRQKSDQRLAMLLARHRGRSYRLEAVAFGEATTYASYTVHRESRFTVVADDGAEVEERFCGSLIEKDGRWKVFSFVTDN